MSNDIEVLKARYQRLLLNGKNSEGTGVLQKTQRKIWKLEAAQNKQLFLRGVIGNTADSDSAILRSNRSEEAIIALQFISRTPHFGCGGLGAAPRRATIQVRGVIGARDTPNVVARGRYLPGLPYQN